MNYSVKTDRPGRIRVAMKGGILQEADARRLARLLEEVPGVRRATPYPRAGEMGISYHAASPHDAASCRDRALAVVRDFVPRLKQRAPRKKPAPHIIEDPLLRLAADAALGVLVPAPVRIAGKIIDTGYRAHAQI